MMAFLRQQLFPFPVSPLSKSCGHVHMKKENYVQLGFREALKAKKSQNCGPFPYGGGRAQPHSIAFEVFLAVQPVAETALYLPMSVRFSD